MKNDRAQRIILLSEDDADDQLMIVRALKSHGIEEVKTTWDGEELLDYLNQRGPFSDAESAPRPSLILLDLNMPRKSGREALREIKTDARFRTIPIIVLTTSAADIDIQESYDAGANAYIIKPVRYAELVEATSILNVFWLDLSRLPDQLKNPARPRS